MAIHNEALSLRSAGVFFFMGEDEHRGDHLFGRIKIKGDKSQCSVRIIN